METSDQVCIVPGMGKNELNELSLQVMIQPSVKNKLRKLAEKNGRSLSGECRHILTQHVARARA